MPLWKNENEAIKKMLLSDLKTSYQVRTFVRVDRLYQKLATEGALSPDETTIKHPLHPDIDVLLWPKTYSGEPSILAAEVKYFRLRQGTVYPNLYDGLGEAQMLLSFGVDSVCLWHLFDPEIPSEITSRYRDLTENLVNETSPINYHSWLLPENPATSDQSGFIKMDLEKLVKEAMESINAKLSLSQIVGGLKANPIKGRWDVQIMRAIIKKAFRIINK